MTKGSSKHGFLLGAIFFSFFAYGLFVTSSGSLTAPLMEYYGINEAERGLIILLQDLGGLAVVLFAVFFGERFSKIKLYFTGVLLLGAAGLAIAGISGIILYTGLLVLWCAGTLLIDVMSNAIISDLYREEQNSYIPLLHLMFGLGAVLSNLITLFILDKEVTDSWKTVYLTFGCISIAAVIWLATAMGRARDTVSYYKTTVAEERISLPEILKMPETWKLFCSMFLFGAFFTGISTWLPYYWEKGLNFDRSFSVLAVSIFFTGVLVVRILNPLLLKKYPLQKIVLWGSTLGGVCMVLSVLLHVPALTVILTAAAGFFTGADFPMLALLACRIYPKRTSFGSSLVLLAYMASALLFPWLVGVISTAAGMLTALLMIFGCLVLCGPVTVWIKEK